MGRIAAAFGEYIGSFLDKYFFWIGIVMLVGDLLEKRLPKVKQFVGKRMPHWTFAGLAILCFFLAGFQAWHEEHQKVLSETTYIGFEPTRKPASVTSVEYFPGKAPAISTDETNGDYPAMNAIQSSGLEIYDVGKTFDPKTFEATPEMEESVWKKFRLDFAPSRPINMEPHRKSALIFSLNRELTEEEAIGLSAPSKILFMLGYAAWTDGSGRHEIEFCHYFPNPPSEMILGYECQTHSGLMQKPAD